MIKIIRRLTSRFPSRPAHEDRREHQLRGPLVRMVECDMASLDILNRGFRAPRG